MQVLRGIRAMLSDPNPYDRLLPSIRDQFQNDRELYDKTAAEWTAQYASEQLLS